MSRPLILNRPAVKTSLEVKSNTINVSGVNLKSDSEKLLRLTRSEEYLEKCNALDVNGCELSKASIQVIVDDIKNSFEKLEIPVEEFPTSLIAKCYLGADFEVHKLDLQGNILLHYRANQKMDEKCEKARNIAQNPNYKVIEIYDSCLRAIDKKGRVSKIKI